MTGGWVKVTDYTFELCCMLTLASTIKFPWETTLVLLWKLQKRGITDTSWVMVYFVKMWTYLLLQAECMSKYDNHGYRVSFTSYSSFDVFLNIECLA